MWWYTHIGLFENLSLISLIAHWWLIWRNAFQVVLTNIYVKFIDILWYAAMHACYTRLAFSPSMSYLVRCHAWYSTRRVIHIDIKFMNTFILYSFCFKLRCIGFIKTGSHNYTGEDVVILVFILSLTSNHDRCFSWYSQCVLKCALKYLDLTFKHHTRPACPHVWMGCGSEQLKTLLLKIQCLKNTAARLVFNLRKYDRITPARVTLQWPPVKYRTEFKTLLVVFKGLHGKVPSYIHEMNTPSKSRIYSMRFTDACVLKVIKFKHDTFGKRAIAVCGHLA